MPSFPTLSLTPPGYGKAPQASEPLQALFPPLVNSYLSLRVVLDEQPEDTTKLPFEESPHSSWGMTLREATLLPEQLVHQGPIWGPTPSEVTQEISVQQLHAE